MSVIRMVKPRSSCITENGIENKPVEGGYILLARKLFGGELMCKPPLYLKLWLWMMQRANWKDRDKLKRGQLISSVEDMREAMSYSVGYRKVKPTRSEVRSAYGFFVKSQMISHTKSTRGIVITLTNFALYQDPKSYGSHSGSTTTTYDTEECEKEKIKTSPRPNCGHDTFRDAYLFDSFWEAYPRKVAKLDAVKAWQQLKPTADEADLMLKAVAVHKRSAQWQKAKAYIPYPATWLRGRRWEDVVEAEEAAEDIDEIAELRAKGVIE